MNRIKSGVSIQSKRSSEEKWGFFYSFSTFYLLCHLEFEVLNKAELRPLEQATSQRIPVNGSKQCSKNQQRFLCRRTKL